MSFQEDRITTIDTIILDKSSDWDNWLLYKRVSAGMHRLWKYVDPSTPPDELPKLVEPEEVQVTSYDPAATSFQDLSEKHFKLYKWEVKQYDIKYERYERDRTALGRLLLEIVSTVAARHIYILQNVWTPYEALRVLKQRFDLSPATRSRELAAKYALLKKGPSRKSIEAWIYHWDMVTTQCKALDMPEVAGTRAKEDFFYALRKIEPSYATAALHDLYMNEHREERNKAFHASVHKA